MKSFIFGLIAWFTVYYTTFYFIEKYVENLPSGAHWAISLGLLACNIAGMIEAQIKS
jgi:hypothetical protein